MQMVMSSSMFKHICRMSSIELVSHPLAGLREAGDKSADLMCAENSCCPCSNCCQASESSPTMFDVRPDPNCGRYAMGLGTNRDSLNTGGIGMKDITSMLGTPNTSSSKDAAQLKGSFNKTSYPAYTCLLDSIYLTIHISVNNVVCTREVK